MNIGLGIGGRGVGASCVSSRETTVAEQDVVQRERDGEDRSQTWPRMRNGWSLPATGYASPESAGQVDDESRSRARKGYCAA